MFISIPLTNSKTLKISLKKLFFPLLIFLIVVIILLKFSELKEIGRLFAQIKWYWLILVFLAQIINLCLYTGVYKKIFELLKLPPLNFFHLIKISLANNFLNLTIPSYGLAGNIYLIKLLKKYGFKEGRVLMMIILQLVSCYLSLIILITFALIYVFIKIHYLGFLPIITTVGFIIFLLFIVWMLHFWLGKKEKAHKRVLWFYKKFYNAHENISPEEKVKKFLADFYEDVGWLKHHKKQLIGPVLIQFIKLLSDGLTVFLIFLAFGALTTYGISLTTFAFGQLFGLISFIPGGIGAFEGAMTLTAKSLGITLELSITVMLIYRLFSYWLYFPLGLIFYKQLDKTFDNCNKITG